MNLINELPPKVPPPTHPPPVIPMNLINELPPKVPPLMVPFNQRELER